MKKNLVIISGLFSGILFLMVFQTRELKYLLCPEMTDVCINSFDYLGSLFLLAPAVFVLSLATYFLNEKSTNFWIKGTSIFFVLYSLATLLIPEDGGRGIMNVFPDARVMTLSLMIAFYFIISAIYFLGVAVSSFQSRK
ncbi:MAG: hypothetical protein KA537_00785 [Candidatus Moranbacteria bacterium]|nr:hypothetical protein [Candidatus Moranbacteria bacterium]